MTILVKATVKFPFTTHLPEDVAENTFWFTVPGVDVEAEFTDIHDAVNAFYHAHSGIAGHDHELATYFPDCVDLSLAHTVYSVIDEATGVQIGESTIDLTTPDVSAETSIVPDGLPNEVALCFSFKAHNESAPELSKARKRGRIYFGPIGGGVEVYTITPYSRPTAYIQHALLNGGQAIFDALNTGAHGVTWVVYSRPIPSVLTEEQLEADIPATPRDGIATPIQEGWTDDEWDTQRRRGEKATTRLTNSYA